MAVPLPGQRLLALLALRHRAVARRSVAAILWPDHDEVQGSARLRSALWRLPASSRDELVTAKAGICAWPLRSTSTSGWPRTTAPWRPTNSCHLHGDVLVDWDEDWVSAERERFRQLRLHRLEQLAGQAQDAGPFSFALQAALAAVAVDPLRESAHRQVCASTWPRTTRRRRSGNTPSYGGCYATSSDWPRRPQPKR